MDEMRKKEFLVCCPTEYWITTIIHCPKSNPNGRDVTQNLQEKRDTTRNNPRSIYRI